MKKINTQKIIYTARKKYLTLNNVVIAVALLIALNWMWGALGMMQRNYALQREINSKQRELQLVELQRDSLALQKRYYQTDEYQELAVRESMGLAMPGERVVILQKEDVPADESQAGGSVSAATVATEIGNTQQWLNFFFGGHARGVEGE